MNKTKDFLLAAVVAAMAFTLSCSGDDSGGEYDGGLPGTNFSSSDTPSNSSSSSDGGSSSSVVDGSCTAADNTATHYCSEGIMKGYVFLIDNRDNQTYKAVVIGSQTWMAENLNYNATGSVCFTTGSCTTHGRLYNWNVAMTVCPTNWHLPSKAEWEVMTTYIGGTSTEGKKLKATSGWYNDGNGTDYYGFSALPGGSGTINGSTINGDYDGNGGLAGSWWTASEHEDYSGYAYYRNIGYYSENAFGDSGDKSGKLSVRCLKDSDEKSSSSSSVPSSSSEILSSSSSGDNTCSADFKTVEIGTQIWMAENLNCDVEGSKCYGESGPVTVDYYNDIFITETLSPDKVQANCVTYGRLYDGATAMTVCPKGWHLPSKIEWDVLITTVGNGAGKKLKATNGWNYSYNGGVSGNGTDEYGFSAMPGGFGFSGGGFSFYWVGDTGGWWSSSNYDSLDDTHYIQLMGYDDDVGWNGYDKMFLFSVRCLKD